MKLDFLDDISEGGKHRQVTSDRIIRISKFTDEEKDQLASFIKATVFEKGEDLDLHRLSFVNAVDCRVRLSLADDNYGLVRDSTEDIFVCRLTPQSYKDMIKRMELLGDGYNWLYDNEVADIDFLISNGGTW